MIAAAWAWIAAHPWLTLLGTVVQLLVVAIMLTGSRDEYLDREDGDESGT